MKIVSGEDAEDARPRSRRSMVRWSRQGCTSAASIEVAEAAGVTENTQRDLNIALMNELAIIFDRLGIPTIDVPEAAGTKWNFLPLYAGPGSAVIASALILII